MIMVSLKTFRLPCIVQTNGREVPDSTLEEAALIAAYYSKAVLSQVPVDWTQKACKNLAGPGLAKLLRKL